jgi:hypothetical protein
VRETRASTVYHCVDVTAILDGGRVLLDDGVYRVVSLNTAPASAWWGRGTRWCTTSPDWFENYRTYGELIYIEHRPTGRRWLLHLHTCEFRNARNRRASGQVFAQLHPSVVNVLRSRIDGDPRATLVFGLTPDGAYIDHSLNLRHLPIRKLPSELSVRDDLDVRSTGITELPPGLKVGGDLLVSAKAPPRIPADLIVGGRILCCDRYRCREMENAAQSRVGLQRYGNT